MFMIIPPYPRQAILFLSVLALPAGTLARPAPAQDAGRITVHVDRPGARISPLLYGLMTEEINYSYDGGLYAELIQNRIFRDPPDTRLLRFRRPGAAPDAPAAPAPAPIPHWSVVIQGGARASIATDTSEPVNTTALTTS